MTGLVIRRISGAIFGSFALFNFFFFLVVVVVGKQNWAICYENQVLHSFKTCRSLRRKDEAMEMHFSVLLSTGKLISPYNTICFISPLVPLLAADWVCPERDSTGGGRWGGSSIPDVLLPWCQGFASSCSVCGSQVLLEGPPRSS